MIEVSIPRCTLGIFDNKARECEMYSTAVVSLLRLDSKSVVGSSQWGSSCQKTKHCTSQQRQANLTNSKLFIKN